MGVNPWSLLTKKKETPIAEALSGILQVIPGLSEHNNKNIGTSSIKKHLMPTGNTISSVNYYTNSQ